MNNHEEDEKPSADEMEADAAEMTMQADPEVSARSDTPDGETIAANEAAEVTEATQQSSTDEAAAAEVVPAPIDHERLAHILESVLFAAGTPVTLRRLVEILDGPALKDVQDAVVLLQAQYPPGQRGIQLHEVAGGLQFRTARENAEWVRALFREKPARLGRAALETLSVVAYKQPVTKAEIESIRGVDVDGTLSTLMGRRLVKIAGRKEAVGRPLLYGTTAEFLEAFGLKDLAELPSLQELGPLPESEALAERISDEENAQSLDGDQAGETFGGGVAAESEAGAEGEGGREDEAGVGDGAPAEAPEPGGGDLEAQRRDDDPRGAGDGERSHGDRDGDEGESEDGSHHS